MAKKNLVKVTPSSIVHINRRTSDSNILSKGRSISKRKVSSAPVISGLAKLNLQLGQKFKNR